VIVLIAGASAMDAGGYLRVMTRPDFEGGDGRLGYWNLYGRLLNEGPYAALELRQEVLERQPGYAEPWSDLHVKIEGGTIQGADSGGGSLAYLRLSQAYVQAGNAPFAGVTWRAGTLESNFGDLGLYDMRPAQILIDTVGLGARWTPGGSRPWPLALDLGIGDAGYSIRGENYDTVFSGGAAARLSIGRHLQLGLGAQLRSEPNVASNRYAPHATPGVSYEDYVRGDVVAAWVAENPGQEADFPGPRGREATSWIGVAYLGFGGWRVLRWNNTFANVQRLHPQGFTTETYDGEAYTIYLADLTDERRQFNIGNEMQLALVPDRLDVAWGLLFGDDTDGDNDIVPSDADRRFWSSVVRAQTFLTPTLHLLVETSLAKEFSRNGNAYRQHYDSIFTGTDGVTDSEGLEYGDSDTRDTWQGKAGFVINPLGPGMYVRPSIRVLYGVQWSSQNNAFGNSFAETQDEYADFQPVERHWHNVVALETEAWF
jgi:hypothetical protein